MIFLGNLPSLLLDSPILFKVNVIRKKTCENDIYTF
jgi:hypothetical protein